MLISIQMELKTARHAYFSRLKTHTISGLDFAAAADVVTFVPLFYSYQNCHWNKKKKREGKNLKV